MSDKQVNAKVYKVSIKQILAKKIPTELQLYWDDQELSTNVCEWEYRIAEIDKNDDEATEKFKALTNEERAEQYPQYNSFVRFLTHKQLEAFNDYGIGYNIEGVEYIVADLVEEKPLLSNEILYNLLDTQARLLKLIEEKM